MGRGKRYSMVERNMLKAPKRAILLSFFSVNTGIDPHIGFLSTCVQEYFIGQTGRPLPRPGNLTHLNTELIFTVGVLESGFPVFNDNQRLAHGTVEENLPVLREGIDGMPVDIIYDDIPFISGHAPSVQGKRQKHCQRKNKSHYIKQP